MEKEYTVNITASFKSNLPFDTINEGLQLAIINERGNIVIIDNIHSEEFAVTNIDEFELIEVCPECGYPLVDKNFEDFDGINNGLLCDNIDCNSYVKGGYGI
jgi:hypothetical protein